MDQTWTAHLNRLRAESSIADQATMDFSVQVLTQGFWPSQKQRGLQLSNEMKNAKSIFDAWYKERHSHRILSWVYILGDVIVKGDFNGRSYDMTMTTFQAMALLGFSCRRSTRVFEEVCDQICIDEATGKRVLHSLACGKYRMLKKTGHHKTINCKSDVFQSNALFYSKLKRFLIQMSTLDGESKKKIDVEVQQ